MDNLKSKGFRAQVARVNFVLFWKKEEDQREYLVVLPEIEFEREKTNSRDLPST